jgi:hypothetical protein
MKEYLLAIINEQINRAISLRAKIPRPPKFRELLGLADKCDYVLDEQIEILRSLEDELQHRPEEDIEDLIRSARGCAREVSYIEYYGISTLYFQTEDTSFLNKLVYQIHQEINLPFGHPCISCTANEYYSCGSIRGFKHQNRDNLATRKMIES